MEYLLIFAVIPLYFIPTILTLFFTLSPENAQKVFFINLVWGWTGIGWLTAFVFTFLGKYEHDAALRASKHKQALQNTPRYTINKQKLSQFIPTKPQEELEDL